MFEFLGGRRREKPQRRCAKTPRRFETLENRLCLTVPWMTSFSAYAGGPGTNVTLSGLVADDYPAGVMVNFSGVVSGYTTVTSGGSFTFNGNASGLGTVWATAFDLEGSSFPRSAAVTSNKPVVNFTVHETGPNREVTISGSVMDEAAAGLTVTFTGVVNDQVVVNGNGQFTLVTHASALGTVTATTTDVWGLTSNPANQTVTSAAPVIHFFTATPSVDGFWKFEGNVEDENAEGLTVTFGGVVSGSTTVEPGGYFSLLIYCPSGTSGIATAQTEDWWGLDSNVAEDWVESI